MRTLHAILPAAVFGCLLTAPVALAAPGTGEDKELNLGSADEPAEAVAQSTASGSIVRTIAGLAIVLGVIYGLYWVLKQIKASKDSAAVSGTGLEALATMPLGANRALHLVRAGREIVLIGTAENAVAPIRRYSEDEAYALGLIEAVAPEPVGASLESLADGRDSHPKGLMDILRSKTVVK